MADTSDEKATPSDIRKVVDDFVDKAITREVKEHNTVFRQMASSLILIAGIFLALASNFSHDLSKASGVVKVLSLTIVVMLNLSILFGVVQLFMEAAFFRQYALGRQRVKTDYPDRRRDGAKFDQYIGAMSELEATQGNGTKRWPTVVQLSCLGIAMILISTTVGLQMYGV